MSIEDKFLVTNFEQRIDLEATKLKQHRLGKDEMWDAQTRPKLDDEARDTRIETKLDLAKRILREGGFGEEEVWNLHLEKGKANDSRINGLWIAYGLWLVANAIVIIKARTVDGVI